MNKNKTVKPAGTSLLRLSLLSGCILLVLIAGVLAGIYASGNYYRSIRAAERESEFSRLLREYDYKCGRVVETESFAVRRQEFERLEGELDRLEEKAGWVESWLSVLKRRRELLGYAGELGNNSHYVQSYRQSAQRAASAFPYSEPIIAIAASALVRDAAITREGEAELRRILPLLADPRLFPLRLGLHVLLGDFGSPEKAAASPLAEISRSSDFVVSVFRQSGVSLADQEAVSIIADLLILRVLAGDIAGAAVDIQSALLAFPSPELTLLAAEYHYDFGDMLRSAELFMELFSLLPDEAYLSRQADALWLAGYIDNARTLWAMLGADALLCRALYNLALTAPTREENFALLQRLAGQDSVWLPRQYGLIRLSRLFAAPQGLALLDAEKGPQAGPADILIDLEILKRRSEMSEVARAIAETWLLLDRYPAAPQIYQWGLWYFTLQRSYAESAVLLKAAGRYGFTDWWMELYEALRLIRESSQDAAEKILAALPPDEHWTLEANLGRLLEARNAPTQALESYERALSAVLAAGAPIQASRIQVRIAHCLRTLGRTEESRRALEYALDLNRDNLNARLELNRLE